jgi:hypothetical protein
MILWLISIIFNQREKKMSQSTKKTRRKTSGMTILGLRKKSIRKIKISQTRILRPQDKGISSSGEQEVTIRLGKELQEKPLTSNSTGTNQTPRDQLLIPMPNQRMSHKSTRTIQIYFGQFKHL